MQYDVAIGFLMAKDPRFEQAYEDLESLDYAVFQAAMNTCQQICHDAVFAHSLTCEECSAALAARHDQPTGSSTYCEIHSFMFQEVAGMSTSPDAPVFQGVM